MTTRQKEIWIAVPDALLDDTTDRLVIWHTTREPLRLDGMSNVVAPERITTLCCAVVDRHRITRTAQLLSTKNPSSDRRCAGCQQGLRVPGGWTLEPLERQPDYVLLSTPPPNRYMATIDFRSRGIRTGYSVSGRFVGEEWNKRRKRPSGRGWKQALVDEAVAHLQEVLR